jgi:hypothetical protein
MEARTDCQIELSDPRRLFLYGQVNAATARYFSYFRSRWPEASDVQNPSAGAGSGLVSDPDSSPQNRMGSFRTAWGGRLLIDQRVLPVI